MDCGIWQHGKGINDCKFHKTMQKSRIRVIICGIMLGRKQNNSTTMDETEVIYDGLWN